MKPMGARDLTPRIPVTLVLPQGPARKATDPKEGGGSTVVDPPKAEDPDKTALVAALEVAAVADIPTMTVYVYWNAGVLGPKQVAPADAAYMVYRSTVLPDGKAKGDWILLTPQPVADGPVEDHAAEQDVSYIYAVDQVAKDVELGVDAGNTGKAKSGFKHSARTSSAAVALGKPVIDWNYKTWSEDSKTGEFLLTGATAWTWSFIKSGKLARWYRITIEYDTIRTGGSIGGTLDWNAIQLDFRGTTGSKGKVVVESIHGGSFTAHDISDTQQFINLMSNKPVDFGPVLKWVAYNRAKKQLDFNDGKAMFDATAKKAPASPSSPKVPASPLAGTPSGGSGEDKANEGEGSDK